MAMRRTAYGVPSFGTPPITWRDATPNVQASWRRAYGCYLVGGKVTACLDSIRPASKTVAASQYLATSVNKPPADANPGFAMSSTAHAALGCQSVGFLSLTGNSRSWTKFWCLKLLAYPSVGAHVDLQSSTPGYPPTQYNFFFVNNAISLNTTRNSTTGTTGFPTPAVPPLNTTFVYAASYDFATTTGKTYLNGAFVGATAIATGTQGSPQSWDAFIGSYSPTGPANDGVFYERLFCTAQLTDPQVATASALMLADYPP